MRDAAIIAVVCVLAILGGGWLYFFQDEQPASSETTGNSIPYTVIAEGTTSGSITSRTNYLIETSDQLRELWSKLYPTDAPNLPSVDFEKYDVIAVFDGTHSSGGYAIEVTAVSDTPDARMVTIRHTAPGEGCITTDAITSPFQILIAPRSSLPIQRIDESFTAECR